MSGPPKTIRVVWATAGLFALASAAGCGWVEWPAPGDTSEPAVGTLARRPVASPLPIPAPKPVARPPVLAVERDAQSSTQSAALPPPPEPPPAAAAGAFPRSAAPAAAAEVRAAQGDTVYALSRRHQVSTRSIIEANELRPPYELTPGQRIVLPRDREHVVAPGESLYGISRTYGIDAYVLASANGLVAPFALLVGQTLRIPAVGSDTAETQSATSAPGIAALRPVTPAGVPPPPPVSGGGFVWPVKGRVISSFGAKSKGLHNDGINIAADRGTPVRAAENGVVAYAGNELRGFGNMLLIKHAGGWITAYAHNEELLVARGDKVQRGQVVARVGSSGSVTRPQLHFELREGKQAVDPVKYLGGGSA